MASVIQGLGFEFLALDLRFRVQDKFSLSDSEFSLDPKPGTLNAKPWLRGQGSGFGMPDFRMNVARYGGFLQLGVPFWECLS